MFCEKKMTQSIKKTKRKSKKVGKGIINTLINKLPFELHVPKYQYCGPGTHLEKRLKRNDPGINELDRACKAHDIAYSNTTNIADRNRADQILAKKAWERVKSKEASIGERTVALGVSGIMKAKAKMGMGMKNKRAHKSKTGSGEKTTNKHSKTSVKKLFQKAVAKAKTEMKSKNPKTVPKAVNLAVQAAKAVVKKHKIPRKCIQIGLP